MKPFLAIIPFLLLLSCSKKARILNEVQTTAHLKETRDSADKKRLVNINRSVITTDVDLDTLLIVKGSPLSGILNFTDSVKHFENDDLNIDFKKDPSGSNILFKASPKIKTVKAQYHRKTTTQNNIIKTEDSKSKTKISLQQDSVYKYVSDVREPAATISHTKSIIIWLVVLLITAITAFVILKRKVI